MIDIIQAVNESKAKKIKQWPTHSNRASLMGHPCERFLVYKRTRWQEEALYDMGRQYIFDEGNLHEGAVLRTLEEAGFKLIEQQRPFEWKKYQITGTIDAKILNDGKVIPIEIKSFSDWSWRAINSIEDMLKSKAVYMRGYPAQMQLYLLLDEKEEGAFILKNKTNGFLKQIDVKLDFSFGESLIQKAERINAHIQAGTLPDRILYDDNVSGVCSFAHICLPEVTHNATLIDDPEMEIKLDRREALKSIVDEYKDLEEGIKTYFKGKPESIIGKWKITSKEVSRKGYQVKDTTYWDTRINSLKNNS